MKRVGQKSQTESHRIKSQYETCWTKRHRQKATGSSHNMKRVGQKVREPLNQVTIRNVLDKT
ncbi:hypothetical protein CHS0354_002319, partial [Potamilus streckersoni]